MRLPFPTRIPMWGACVFSVALVTAQLIQGTALLFSLCCFLFIVIATAAFNLAGGFSRTSGAYVFCYSTLAVIVGLCTKAVIGEAADSNLGAPQRTISVFLGGIAAMYGAIFVSRKLTPRKAFLQDLVNDRNMQNATVGCMVTGFLIFAVQWFVPRENGSVISALNQINRFFPMAIILGTIHQIRKSGGTSSINIPVIISSAGILYLGIFGFSKEAIFTPLVCWLVAAASQNYRVSRIQFAALAVTVVLMFRYLVPYSQIGRNYEFPENPTATRYDVCFYLLSHLGQVRQEYKQVRSFSIEQGNTYFGVDVGFFERLEMLSVDAGLIDVTDRQGSFGILPLIQQFENLVPHFIWADKPVPIGGNYYAHEVGGMITEDDNSTGISFSPTGEAYHLERWIGIFILAPILWTMLFTLFDSLCGDTRVAPWGLLMVAYYAHMAPEGMLGGVIYAMGFVMVSIIMAALSSAYLMPILGSLTKGPERTVVRRTAAIRSVPRQSRPLPAPGAGQ